MDWRVEWGIKTTALVSRLSTGAAMTDCTVDEKIKEADASPGSEVELFITVHRDGTVIATTYRNNGDGSVSYGSKVVSAEKREGV
jgi:predicted RNA-binding protein (virulence factor B family)